MPIQENAINAALAEALSNHGVHATPEQTRASSGSKRCDIQIRSQHDSSYFTAVECKIGQNSTQKGEAVKDAQRWLKQSNCWNAIALCYSEEISQDAQTTPQQRIAMSVDLLMAKVNLKGVIGRWHTGEVSDLVRLANDVGARNTYVITDILKKAIIAASSEYINAQTGKDLAKALELLWKPSKDNGIDHRPARIACLIIANMALLQNQMHSQDSSIIPGLESLAIVKEAPNKKTSLLDNWKKIRQVDYAPVVDPAILILHKLPDNHATDALLRILIEAVLNCAPLIRGLQLDHAGPLYHELLQTARYDGSFYTSTAAAVLLSELAMPPNWFNNRGGGHWSDIEKIADLKICDPACGTGTLLMSSAITIERRFLSVPEHEDSLNQLHLNLIEKVLHGLDINRHAIHLAASMLTLSAPKINYDKMNLYNMQHGVNANHEVRAGSLDLLVDDASFKPYLALETLQERATAKGYKAEAPNLQGCDLVIMNPPFTRNDIRNKMLPPKICRQVQNRENEIARTTPDQAHREAIRPSTVFSFFTPIADRLLNRSGTVAIVQPFAACTGADASGHRALLTDPDRFHLEMVVTSHDNRRIYFSENTDIHESLVIARRPTPETQGTPTAFVSLCENPERAIEAHFLAEAIQAALDGDQTLLAEYGTIAWRTLDQLRGRVWNAACFYHQSLADIYDDLLNNSSLATLGQVAAVTPDGRGVRKAFNRAQQRQNPDRRALYDHCTSRQTSMRTYPDQFLVAKRDEQSYAASLWEKRNHLLLASRMRLNLVQTPAVFSDEQILGSAFVPVHPNNQDTIRICKAWCVWFNSTLGVLSFLNVRQKHLTYPYFSLVALRSLPVPDPDHCDIDALEQVFNQYADSALLPLPQMHLDPVRQALDDAINRAIPELSTGIEIDFANLRRNITLEPTVNNQIEPFRL